MTEPEPNKYVWRREINRAIRANQIARAAIKRIINDEPGPGSRNLLLAQVSNAVAENFDALYTLAEIAGMVDKNTTAPAGGDSRSGVDG